MSSPRSYISRTLPEVRRGRSASVVTERRLPAGPAAAECDRARVEASSGVRSAHDLERDAIGARAVPGGVCRADERAVAAGAQRLGADAAAEADAARSRR